MFRGHVFENCCRLPLASREKANPSRERGVGRISSLGEFCSEPWLSHREQDGSPREEGAVIVRMCSETLEPWTAVSRFQVPLSQACRFWGNFWRRRGKNGTWLTLWALSNLFFLAQTWPTPFRGCLLGCHSDSQYTADQCQLSGAGEAAARRLTGSVRGHERVLGTERVEGEDCKKPRS